MDSSRTLRPTRLAKGQPFALVSFVWDLRSLLVLLLASTNLLIGCGGTRSNASQSVAVAGNWQFNMTAPGGANPAPT